MLIMLPIHSSRPGARSNQLPSEASALGQTTQQIARPNNLRGLCGVNLLGIKMMAMTVASMEASTTQQHQTRPTPYGGQACIIMIWTKQVVLFVLNVGQDHKVPVLVATMIVNHSMAFQI
jgi:hypothetical protein